MPWLGYHTPPPSTIKQRLSFPHFHRIESLINSSAGIIQASRSQATLVSLAPVSNHEIKYAGFSLLQFATIWEMIHHLTRFVPHRGS